MNLTKVSIITGFLGVGKTTFIKQLLDIRPKSERWAIIVNEFGEVGVDALLLQDPSVQVKQVSGGCACCISQMPFQLALNALLKPKNLDRIFIEPSGLGHADSLIKVLNQPQYETWLTLKPTVTIIDPIQFKNSKYREHDIYQRQLKAADIFYINKLAHHELSNDNLKDIIDYSICKNKPYIKEYQSFDKTILSYLDDEALIKTSTNNTGYEFKSPKKDGRSGFYHAHYKPDASSVYDHRILINLLSKQSFERVKAVLNTELGQIVINGALGEVHHELYKDDVKNTIIEVISHNSVSSVMLENLLHDSLVGEK